MLKSRDMPFDTCSTAYHTTCMYPAHLPFTLVVEQYLYYVLDQDHIISIKDLQYDLCKHTRPKHFKHALYI